MLAAGRKAAHRLRDAARPRLRRPGSVDREDVPPPLAAREPGEECCCLRLAVESAAEVVRTVTTRGAVSRVSSTATSSPAATPAPARFTALMPSMERPPMTATVPRKSYPLIRTTTGGLSVPGRRRSPAEPRCPLPSCPSPRSLPGRSCRPLGCLVHVPLLLLGRLVSGRSHGWTAGERRTHHWSCCSLRGVRSAIPRSVVRSGAAAVSSSGQVVMTFSAHRDHRETRSPNSVRN